MPGFQTGYRSTLAAALTTSATIATLSTPPVATSGRMLIFANNITEWISYTWVSGSTITGLTRNLSQTADPVTWGTGLAWAAWTQIIMVAMHDNLIDKESAIPIVWFTTVQRDALNMSQDYFTWTYPIIYNTTAGEYQYYNWAAWASFATGTVADATNLIWGKVKVTTADPGNTPTVLNSTSGRYAATVGNNTDVAVGAGNLFVTQTGLQHNAESYAVISSGSSTTYAVTLSPAPTSLTAGMSFKAKIDVANTTTTPTVNVNGTGAKTIVKWVNTALAIGDMPVNLIADLVYDGANVVLQNPLTTIPFTNWVTTRTADTASGTQTIAHGGGKEPKFVEISANYAVAVSGTVSNISRSEGSYNGTTNSCIYEAYTLGNGAGTNALTTGNSSTQWIYIQQSGTAGNTQVWVITKDATNITITWTKTGTLAANPININWKASF